MAHVLDHGGILIARLPKGQLGEDTSRLLGSMIFANVWQAATARARQPEHRRRDATIVIDEAHNILNLAGSTADMLAEARGYRLSLVLAHQHLGQLPREVQLAISANARNKIYFTCSPEDAHQLARHTLPELDEHDLAHLDAYTAAARLVIANRRRRRSRYYQLCTRARSREAFHSLGRSPATNEPARAANAGEQFTAHRPAPSWDTRTARQARGTAQARTASGMATRGADASELSSTLQSQEDRQADERAATMDPAGDRLALMLRSRQASDGCLR